LLVLYSASAVVKNSCARPATSIYGSSNPRCRRYRKSRAVSERSRTAGRILGNRQGSNVGTFDGRLIALDARPALAVWSVQTLTLARPYTTPSLARHGIVKSINVTSIIGTAQANTIRSRLASYTKIMPTWPNRARPAGALLYGIQNKNIAEPGKPDGRPAPSDLVLECRPANWHGDYWQTAAGAHTVGIRCAPIPSSTWFTSNRQRLTNTRISVPPLAVYRFMLPCSLKTPDTMGRGRSLPRITPGRAGTSPLPIPHARGSIRARQARQGPDAVNKGNGASTCWIAGPVAFIRTRPFRTSTGQQRPKYTQKQPARPSKSRTRRATVNRQIGGLAANGPSVVPTVAAEEYSPLTVPRVYFTCP